MTASELSSNPPVTPTDLVERAKQDLVAGDPVGAQTAALVAIAAALVERAGPKDAKEGDTPDRRFVDDHGRRWEWCGGVPGTWAWRVTGLGPRS